jgi:hypothetical protein
MDGDDPVGIVPISFKMSDIFLTVGVEGVVALVDHPACGT